MAWKVIAGIRPISIIGVELEYIDFGHPSNPYDPNNSNVTGCDSHPRAAVLFAVGYLPLPIPFIDIFAKAGVARLQTDVTTTTSSCPAGANCLASAHRFPPQRDRQQVRLRSGSAVQSSVGLRISRRVRADQLAIRRSRCADGQRDVAVLKALILGVREEQPIDAHRAPHYSADLGRCDSDSPPVLGSCTASRIWRLPAFRTRRLGRCESKVDTIVVIYAENRAFDNLYGNFPGARRPERGRRS